MILQDLRDMVANFEGADGNLPVVIPDEETGQIVDLDVSASIKWFNFENVLVYESNSVGADTPNATKVFLIQ